jgi:outer membrane murein-binding lipoprotein Lpp
MKRADLEVGKSYYYSRNQDWMHNGYNSGRIVIVDAGHWEESGWIGWSGRNREPIKITKGGGVLVDVETPVYGDKSATKMIRKVVNLAHIRGEYDETFQKVQNLAKIRDERYLADCERRDDNDKIATAVQTLAAQHGIKARQEQFGSTNMVISAAALEALIEKAYGETK